MLNTNSMSERHRNRTFGALCAAAFSALAFLGMSGVTASLAAPTPSKRAAPAQVAAGSSYDKDTYKVDMKLSGACKAGSECKVEIALASKGEFHINDKYPIKFKAPDTVPEGLTFTKSIVKKEDGKFGEKEGTLPVAFTIAKAGKVNIAGTFSFSVCSDANCVMEKVELALDVEAK